MACMDTESFPLITSPHEQLIHVSSVHAVHADFETQGCRLT